MSPEGSATFELKAGQSATATDLPNGITYKAEEADYTEEGYTSSATGAIGTITGNATQTAAFTNTRNLQASSRVSTIPSTGDTNNPFFWLSMCFVSLVGMVGSRTYGKVKKNHSK